MNIEILETPFDNSLIKTRKGSFGAMLSYVEVEEYIKRLNAIFDYDWSFDIVEDRIEDKFVMVKGKLIAGGISKMQYGVSTITLGKSTGEITQIVDDYKAAASDCLKKCASLFGIGLHLHGSNGDKPPAKADKKIPPKKTPTANPKSATNPTEGADDAAIKKANVKAHAIAEGLGMTHQHIHDHAVANFAPAKSVNDLILGQWEVLIGRLNKLRITDDQKAAMRTALKESIYTGIGDNRLYAKAGELIGRELKVEKPFFQQLTIENAVVVLAALAWKEPETEVPADV